MRPDTSKNISAEHNQPDDEPVYSGDETFIIKKHVFITKIWFMPLLALSLDNETI